MTLEAYDIDSLNAQEPEALIYAVSLCLRAASPFSSCGGTSSCRVRKGSDQWWHMIQILILSSARLTIADHLLPKKSSIPKAETAAMIGHTLCAN